LAPAVEEAVAVVAVVFRPLFSVPVAAVAAAVEEVLAVAAPA
jgi:hypothetical protein